MERQTDKKREREREREEGGKRQRLLMNWRGESDRVEISRVPGAAESTRGKSPVSPAISHERTRAISSGLCVSARNANTYPGPTLFRRKCTEVRVNIRRYERRTSAWSTGPAITYYQARSRY